MSRHVRKIMATVMYMLAWTNVKTGVTLDTNHSTAGTRHIMYGQSAACASASHDASDGQAYVRVGVARGAAGSAGHVGGAHAVGESKMPTVAG